MIKVNDILGYLETIAPVGMKMDFDNVGLLVGSGEAEVRKILVSLDITGASAAEAADTGAELIVSHHPLFFTLKSVTDADSTGRKIIKLLTGGVSAICMHTNLDAARGGVNDALAAAAGISGGGAAAELLSEDGRLDSGETFSYGRAGFLNKPRALTDYLEMLKISLGANGLRYYDAGREVYKIAVVGGSGGGDLHHAIGRNCDTFVTADIKYDVFLEAMERGINLIDGGHFCTENLVTRLLADYLLAEFPNLEVAISKKHGQIVKYY